MTAHPFRAQPAPAPSVFDLPATHWPACQCGHPAADHGDRAVSACAVPVPTTYTFGPRCPCPGYRPT